MIQSLEVRSIHWLIDWLFGRLIDWLVDCLVDWLIGWLVDSAKSLLQIAADAGLTSYLNLVQKADYATTVDVLHNVTVFAPSNRAIDRLPDELRANLSQSSKDLADILNYHTVQPAVLLSDFKDNLLITALDGKTLRMNIYEAVSKTFQHKFKFIHFLLHP